MNRLLTEKVRSEMLKLGIDLVGFGPVERWKNAPFLLSPQSILPEAKTVVVGAVNITDTWTELGGEPHPQSESPGGWMRHNSFLDMVAYRIVRLLNANGAKAIAVAASSIWQYRPTEGTPAFAPDLSHIHAATAAGLAEIGWSGLAITPEYGSRCRFISIITNAELVPTPMYNGPKLCDKCMECVRHCPSAALRKELQQPHKVTIGGKTFEYANKNMWRCAWAENFKLDLNSENLKKWDKIGEDEIIQALTAEVPAGHERGVCQKVCVPPHLRTKELSFGRNKMIAQNRINRKYPQNMHTLRKLRDDLISAAIEMGAEISSVASFDAGSDTGSKLVRDLPGARTLIAFGKRSPGGVSNYANDRNLDIWMTNFNTMHYLLMRIVRMIEDSGYHALPYTGSVLHDITVDSMAEMAGLGKLNCDGILTTPEWGVNILSGIIATDAPFEPAPIAQNTEAEKTVPAPEPYMMRKELEQLAESNLASMFGIAPAEIFAGTVEDLKANVNEAELGEHVEDMGNCWSGPTVPEVARDNATIKTPQDYLADAKSVIVIGMHFPKEIIENAGLDKTKHIGTYSFWQRETATALSVAALKIVDYLERRGMKAIPSEDMLNIGSQTDVPVGRVKDGRSNAIEAVAAGLGSIGDSGMLLHPEFGAHQRRIVIITNAELPVDKPVDRDVCSHCKICQSKCPMNALENNFFEVRLGQIKIKIPIVERHRCDWSKKYSLCMEEGPALIGKNTKVEIPAGHIGIEEIAEAFKKKDPIGKNITCIFESCMKFCKAGNIAMPGGSL